MAETTGIAERRTYEWMSREECDKERANFLGKNKVKYLTILESGKVGELFGDLSPESKDKGAELLTRFFFGVWMAYRRLGFKYSVYDITFDTSGREDRQGLAFNEVSNRPVINPKFFRKVLEISEGGGCFISGAGIEKTIPAEDFFEIAGVEEAAHLMFYNEKGYLDCEALAQADEEYKSFTSDMESRALVWKVGYVKRYFPQYYDDLKRTAEKVKKIRLASVKT